MINNRNLLYKQYLNSQDDADFREFKGRKEGKQRRSTLRRGFLIIREIQGLHGKLSMSSREIRQIVSCLTLI